MNSRFQQPTANSQQPPLKSPLLTDLYQLTMAYGYWKLGLADKEAVFHLTFRKSPFQGGFSIACGLAQALEFVCGLKFAPDDLAYLAELQGDDGKPLFIKPFLDYLGKLEFECDMHAIPEGSVVFPHEPLLRVKGSILQCQILETALLNIMNFQTLIATKAARVCMAARGDPVVEFGLRRAQGFDGALTASRAAYIGGCESTSNVLAGKVLGIPVRGTHAHSWVMTFENELEAFEAYASVMPNNSVLLVDTYNTLDGVRKAIEVGKHLKEKGHRLAGIRLDSGDLAYLSIEARKILDAAGFSETRIVASNDLDEHIIASLKEQGAAISVWGVGTKLITAYDQPALGGVYKLSAIRGPGQAWEYKLKLSEQSIKISTPGILQVRRYISKDGQCVADMIYDEGLGVEQEAWMTDPADPTRQRATPENCSRQDLLVPVIRAGKCIYESPPLPKIRERVQQQLASFYSGIKRFVNPHQYPVGLERRLDAMKTRLILKARGISSDPTPAIKTPSAK